MRSTRSIYAVLIGTVLALSACGQDERQSAALSTGAARERAPASRQVQEATGLSHLPAPESQEALAASMRRHYPARFIGVRPRSAVLVDVDVSEQGVVRDVRVVDRTGMDDGDVRAVLLKKVPGTNQVVEREVRTVYDAAFGPAAQAAVREVRFAPALREGRPVPYTLRMTVEFADPASRS